MILLIEFIIENLQRLAIEIYKFKHNLGPEILNEIFESNSNTYNTRSDKTVNTRVVKSVFNGTETCNIHGTKNLGYGPSKHKTGTFSK